MKRMDFQGKQMNSLGKKWINNSYRGRIDISASQWKWIWKFHCILPTLPANESYAAMKLSADITFKWNKNLVSRYNDHNGCDTNEPIWQKYLRKFQVYLKWINWLFPLACFKLFHRFLSEPPSDQPVIFFDSNG